MPNLKGFTPQSNPEWVTLEFDDGSQSHPIHDPSGTYRAEVASIVPKVMGGAPPDPMAGALASNDLSGVTVVPTRSDAGGISPLLAPAPVAPPVPASDLGGIVAVGGAAKPGQLLSDIVPSAPRAPGPVIGDAASAIGSALAGQGAPSFAPPPVKSLVKPEVGRSVSDERGPAPDPYAARYTMPGASGPQVSSTTQRTTQGLSAADRAKVDAANEAAVVKAEEANKQDMYTRSHQFLTDWQRLGEDAKKQIADKNALDEQEKFYNQRIEAQYAKLDQDAARKIDPSEAFAGDAGAYAFMAAFGDAISNFGAALAGRGPVADPAARLEGIINRNVKLQMEQKQADLDSGKISASRFEADREHVRFKIATVAKQMVETERERAHTKEEYEALGALGKKFEADQAATRAANAKATARQENNTRSTSVAPGSPGGGSPYFQGGKEEWDKVNAHSQRSSGVDMQERGIGRLEKATGWTWDSQANNGAGGYVGSDGKPVTTKNASAPGTSALGQTFGFLAGEGGREVQGAIEEAASGVAKATDPEGSLSDGGVKSAKDTMNANTDEGLLLFMERTRRNLGKQRAEIDSGFAPGVVNASRLRRQEERGFQSSRPGLPTSREATPEDLRRKPERLPQGEMR